MDWFPKDTHLDEDHAGGSSRLREKLRVEAEMAYDLLVCYGGAPPANAVEDPLVCSNDDKISILLPFREISEINKDESNWRIFFRF